MAAFARARHLLSGDPVVFADPLALELLSARWRFVARHRWSRFLADRIMLRGLQPLLAALLVRARYAEERLMLAVQRGIRQYVLLGAGLDSFALRRPDLSEGLRVFECDTPGALRAKRARVAAAGYPWPQNLIQVPVNLNVDDIGQQLRRSGVRDDEPIFASLLGASYYLDADALPRILNALATFARGGVELVFDYARPPNALSSEERRRIGLAQRLTARRAEATQTFFDPEEMEKVIEDQHYKVVEHLRPSEMTARFILPVDYPYPVYGAYHYVAAQSPAKS